MMGEKEREDKLRASDGTGRTVEVLRYDAFCTEAGKGNPAGIVLDGDSYTDDEMQTIAARVGFNETTFVQKSEHGDLKLKFYTPGHEMNLCGHATIATCRALADRGAAPQEGLIHIETKAGVLPIELSGDGRIAMRQAPAEFSAYNGSRRELAEVMGLMEEDLDPSMPVVYGSTGIWTLLVPVRGLEPFRRMLPANSRFPGVLQEMPRVSLHPFTMETIRPDCQMHARHFSSAYSGTVEDPVTGTASGVMGAYWLSYIDPERQEISLTVEQGMEIGKNGQVGVQALRKNGIIEVTITGTAVYADIFRVEL
jgi:PhzF family phenazine biosynthesis protein